MGQNIIQNMLLNTLMCNADIQESIGVESRRKMEFTYFSIPVKLKFPFQ